MTFARSMIAALVLSATAARVLAGEGAWTPVGPTGRPALTIEGGSTSERIVVDPHAGGIVYAAGPDGFFRSTNAGATWSRPLPRGGIPALSLPLIVPDPHRAGIVLAKVGDAAGILKSTDAGQTFVPTSLTTFVYSLAFDPTTPDRLYAVTSSGFVSSADAGETWAGAAPGPQFAPVGPALALDAGAPGTVWAARGGGLQKSVDGGQTWEPTGWSQDFLALHAAQGNPTTLYLVTEPDDLVPGSDIRRSVDGGDTWQPAGPGVNARVLVLDPMTPTILLAVSTDTEGDVHVSYLHRSTDGGDTWEPPAPFGSVVNDLAIDPTSTSIFYAATQAAGVLKSTNGGTDWSPLGNEGGQLYAYAIEVEPGSPSTLYLGTDLGFFRSGNGGQTWSLTGAFGQGPFQLARDPTTPGRLFATTVIQLIPEPIFAGIVRSDDGGANWSEPLLTLSDFMAGFTALAVDPSRSGIVYAGVRGRSLFGGLVRSPDAGETWPEIVVFPPDPGPRPTGFMNDIVVDSDDGSVYVASGPYQSSGVFRSADDGAHWTPLLRVSPSAVAIDPSDRRVLYAGTGRGELFKSTDRGETWASLGHPAGDRGIVSLLVDTVSDRVFAGTTNGVLATGNGGATWTDLGPPRRIYDLALDPARPNTILAASDASGLIEWEIVPCGDDAQCDDGNACTADACRPGGPNQDISGCTHTRSISLTTVSSCLFGTPLGEGVCEPGTDTLTSVRARVQVAHQLLLRAAARRTDRQARLIRRARRQVAVLARRLARRSPSDVSPSCRDMLVGELRTLRLAISGLR